MCTKGRPPTGKRKPERGDTNGTYWLIRIAKTGAVEIEWTASVEKELVWKGWRTRAGKTLPKRGRSQRKGKPTHGISPFDTNGDDHEPPGKPR